MTITLRRTLATLGIAAILAGSSQAATVHNSLASFLAAIQPGSYTESFDSLATGSVSSPIGFAGNGFTYNASITGDFFNLDGGGGDVWISTNDANTDIVFTFTSGNVTAVGGLFFLTDFGGSPTSGTTRVQVSDGTFVDLLNASSSTFVGFTSDTPLASLTVQVLTPGTFATANDLQVGAAVSAPEPGSAALLLAPALLGLVRRRRRQ